MMSAGLPKNIEAALSQVEADVRNLTTSLTKTYENNKEAIDDWLEAQKKGQQEVTESVESLTESTEEATQDVVEALETGTSNLSDYASEIESELIADIVAQSESLGTLVSEIKAQVEAFVSEVTGSVENAVENVSETVSNAATEIADDFGSFGESITSELEGSYEDLASCFSECQVQLNAEYDRVTSKFEELSDIYKTLTELIDLSKSGVEPATDALAAIMDLLEAVA